MYNKIRIVIGDYEISSMISAKEGRVWIEHKSGEGGEFSLEAFEKVIEKFYNDNF